MMTNISPCFEGRPNGPTPKTLLSVGVKRIVGRKVTRWSPNIGSYGMGGCGFFALQLSPTKDYPKEWLLLMVRRGEEWLLLNKEKIIDGVYEQILRRQNNMGHWWFSIYYRILLLFGWFRSNLLEWPGLGEWDQVSKKIARATIIEADITDHTTIIRLQKYSRIYALEITDKRHWNPDESQLTAWGITETDNIIC